MASNCTEGMLGLTAGPCVGLLEGRRNSKLTFSSLRNQRDNISNWSLHTRPTRESYSSAARVETDSVSIAPAQLIRL